MNSKRFSVNEIFSFPISVKCQVQLKYILSLAIHTIALFSGYRKWQGRSKWNKILFFKSQTDRSLFQRAPYFPKSVFTRPSSLREWLNVISRVPSIREKIYICGEDFFSYICKKRKMWVWELLESIIESGQMTQEKKMKEMEKEKEMGIEWAVSCVFVLTDTFSFYIVSPISLMKEREGGIIKNSLVWLM